MMRRDPPDDVKAIDAEASVLMKRGIGLMSSAQPADITEALACFDRALDKRRALPIDDFPLLRYGLAACWLNRADALTRLDRGAQLAAALQSYDEGILLLLRLPLEEDPRFPRRLAMAHHNRGLSLLAQPAGDFADAVIAFSEAIAVLEHDQSALIPDRQYLLAVVWMNLANARAARTTSESAVLARDAARRAMALAESLEVDDADAAEAGLKARHILCQTIASRLSQPAALGAAMPDDVHEATDVADDGLHLVQRWEQKGVARFRGIAYDLFRFGARVYARYQPQFLDEFVRDHLDPARSSLSYVESAEMQSAAREARGLGSRADIQAPPSGN